ncbi:MAG: CDP-alcohol phosphatidyltransferase family protein [Thermoguttaceae bacterium]
MTSGRAVNADPPARARAFPISRWYAIPVAARLASWLKPTAVRPTHVTLVGLLFGLSAAGLLFTDPAAGTGAAALILAAWVMDRTDGVLARTQNSVSPFGAWLDANIDELHEVAWHTAAASAAAAVGRSPTPWFLLIAFLVGKYLFVTGLAEERALVSQTGNEPDSTHEVGSDGWLRGLYHLPGNADLRLHLLVAALVTGLVTVELAWIAAYYNFRWLARYGLTARRLGGCP